MVYCQGWMCLNDKCPQYWKVYLSFDKEVNEIHGAPPERLNYIPSFLRRTPTPTSPALTIPPHDLRPPSIGDKDIFYNGNDVSKVFWRGIQCPKCGKLNSRELFSHWHCFGCDLPIHKQERTIYTATQLADPDRGSYTGVPIVVDWVKAGSEIQVRQEVRQVGEGWYRCAIYDFPKGGTVIHMIPSIKAIEECDEMFAKYQTQDIEFRRCRMANRKGIV